MTRAELTLYRKHIACGECGKPLARRDRAPTGRHYLSWSPEWRRRGGGGLARITRRHIRGGYAQTLSATGAVAPRRVFPCSAGPAVCPRCGVENELIASLLDVVTPEEAFAD